MNTPSKKLRPYELTGQKYALWFDAGALGSHAQAAVANALCSGSMELHSVYPLDERTLLVISEMAKRRGVLLRVPKAA